MKEMEEYKRKNIKIKVYSSCIFWQRKTNDNTNDLIRKFFGTDFNKVNRS